MQFNPPLQEGILQRRYKRFLADVDTADNNSITIHCPNTGAMTGCAEPGYKVWYSKSANPKRKYPHTWELAVDHAGHWIVINTGHANKVAEEAILNQKITSLQGYSELRREVRYGQQNSRIDLLLKGPGRADCYVEVKSVTLHDNGTGYFPDTVSIRARKHVEELIHIVENGQRGVLLFVAGHSAIQQVSPAAHIDPSYAKLCIEAAKRGVELIALSCRISAQGIEANGILPLVSK